MNYCRKPSSWPVIVIAVGILLVAAPLHAAKPAKSAQPSAPTKIYMHKCTDEKGHVFYSDRPDLDCPQSVGMNKHGLKLDKAAPAPPRPAAVKKEEPTAASVEQARRDKAIMETYTAESQIEEAKARNLEPPMQALKLAQRQLDRAIAKRDSFRKQSDQLTAQKKPLPPGLTEDLRMQEENVARLEQELARRQAHADQVAERFDADLKRYRELTGAAAPR